MADSKREFEVLLAQMKEMQSELQLQMQRRFGRRVPFGDLVTDRWENAASYGFGKGTSCYDSAVVIGDVKVGRHCWIGPNVVLDGQGGLEIGDYCAISAGVQIYSHHTVRRCIQMDTSAMDLAPTRIGSGVYIGPNAVVQMGVTIGDKVVIGAISLVTSDIPNGVLAWGCPARVIGKSDGYSVREQ